MRARAALAHALMLVGCGSGDSAEPDAGGMIDAPTGEPVTIQFAAQVNGAAFACGQVYEQVGSPAAPFSASDFRLFVHDVMLTGDAGSAPVQLDQDAWQRAGFALLDFEDGCGMGTPAMHTALTGRVAPGTYTGISFKLGLPAEVDHLDASTAAAPLDDTTLWWVWRAGYKYVKVDGQSGTSSFNLHLGATGCPGGSSTAPPTGACASPNVPQIALSGYSASRTIVADLGVVLATSNVAANTANTAPGCMSDTDDPDCMAILPRLALPFGATPAGAEMLFAVH